MPDVARRARGPPRDPDGPDGGAGRAEPARSTTTAASGASPVGPRLSGAVRDLLRDGALRRRPRARAAHAGAAAARDPPRDRPGRRDVPHALSPGRSRSGSPGALLQRYLDRLDAAIAVSRACLAPLEGGCAPTSASCRTAWTWSGSARGRRLRHLDDGKLNVLWVGRARAAERRSTGCSRRSRWRGATWTRASSSSATGRSSRATGRASRRSSRRDVRVRRARRGRAAGLVRERARLLRADPHRELRRDAARGDGGGDAGARLGHRRVPRGAPPRASRASCSRRTTPARGRGRSCGSRGTRRARAAYGAGGPPHRAALRLARRRARGARRSTAPSA